MRNKSGFTLVELLVVIAIISILAAIVTPRVQGHILRSRMTAAEAEVRTIDIAITKLLTDAGKTRLSDLFQDGFAPFDDPLTYTDVLNDVEDQTDLFYRILRQGRNAKLADNSDVPFAEGVKERLGTSYMPDMKLDPWDRRYLIYAGPWEGIVDAAGEPVDGVDTVADHPDIPFRSWRLAITTPEAGFPAHGPTDDIDDPAYIPYMYDEGAQRKMDKTIPGNPQFDSSWGFPAPNDMVVYIFSTGANLVPDQNYVLENNLAVTNSKVRNKFKGGGDDINSWDKSRGWQGFYAG